jgi:hypothetical protein
LLIIDAEIDPIGGVLAPQGRAAAGNASRDKHAPMEKRECVKTARKKHWGTLGV